MTVPAFLSVSGSPITTSGTLAVSLSGTALPIANGGTAGTSQTAAFDNLSPLTTAGDILYYNGTHNVRLAVGSTGNVLTVSGGEPSWAAPATSGTVTSVAMSVPSFLSVSGSPVTSTGTLAVSLSGTALPVANGGTGDTSFTAYSVICGGTTSTGALQNVSGVGTSGQVLTSNGASALPTWQNAGSGSGTVTSVALSVPGSSLFSVSGSPVTSSGTLTIATTGTSGGIPYFNTTSTLNSSGALTANQLVLGGGAGSAPTSLAAGSQYQVLTMGSSNPGYGAVNLAQSAAITGTLPVAHGGTGVTSVTTAPTANAFAGWDSNESLSANNFIEGYASTATAAATTTLTVASAEQQYFTGSTTQTVLLPVVSTLTYGQSFHIVNLSSGVVTVQSSGANTLEAMAANTALVATVIAITGTGTASWSWTYLPLIPSSGGGVTTVGSFSGSSETNGASISTTTITFGPADTTNPGMIVASGSQTLGATLTLNNQLTLSGGAVASEQVYFAEATLTQSGTSIAWNVNTGQAAAVTLSGSSTVTLSNPTNVQNGATYTLIVTQPASGGPTPLSYGTSYYWPGGVTPTLSTGASAVDILTFVAHGGVLYGVAQFNFQT